MYTVYKMKNELGEEVKLVEKKEFDKVLERNQKALSLLMAFGGGRTIVTDVINILQGKEGASKGE